MMVIGSVNCDVALKINECSVKKTTNAICSGKSMSAFMNSCSCTTCRIWDTIRLANEIKNFVHFVQCDVRISFVSNVCLQAGT